MKFKIFVVSIFMVSSALAELSNSELKIPKLSVSFADTAWDGVNIPSGQQCQKFGGTNPKTPMLSINNIPSGTTDIVMEYSDRSYKKMDNGGHGKIGYKVTSGAKNVVVPSLLGHTFELPEGFYSIAAHQSPNWDTAGAYMPPCSGGKSNSYYVTVKAVNSMNGNKALLGKTVFELGRY